MTERNAPAGPPASSAAEGAAGARRTVLYIEDNPVNTTLMAAMLETLDGVRMLGASTPEAGLVLAEREQPDLVLLDIQMPGMDGYEVLQRLRAGAATAHLSVMAVSANAMPQDLERGRAAGFAAYLTKPLHLPTLLRTVCQALALPEPANLPAD